MEAKAVSKYIRISPRKTRLVIDLVRKKKADNSVQILEAMNKRAAKIISKVLASAIANAAVKDLNVDNLWIKKAFVDKGPIYKRFMPRAMGRATAIKKPTSHITIILSDEGKGRKAEIKQPEPKKKRAFPKLGRKNVKKGKDSNKIKNKGIKKKRTKNKPKEA